MSSANAQSNALSVAELTRQIKDQLGAEFSSVWVVGEISNLSQPASGHCYFTLKDDTAQLRCVMWRSAVAKLRFKLTDGMEVICRGGIDVYPPRGSYQLIAQRIEPRGEGALQLALKELQAKLNAEGLFDPRRKRPLPAFPRRIAVVTSPTAAALSDFLEVLRRRWNAADVLLSPTRVQGKGSEVEIAAAIKRVAFLADRPDVLVVTRGGGSLEDLWSFNEEVVVRAIAASPIPVISAIGHEIDVTLADLAADVRALTPSEAAELAAPSQTEVAAALAAAGNRLDTAIGRQIDRRKQRVALASASPAIRDPYFTLRRYEQRIDELQSRLDRVSSDHLETAKQSVGRLAGQLSALSPLAVLARGYSITSPNTNEPAGANKPTTRPLTNVNELTAGDVVRTKLLHGEFTSRVEDITPEEDL